MILDDSDFLSLDIKYAVSVRSTSTLLHDTYEPIPACFGPIFPAVLSFSALQSISFAPRVIQLHKCACIAGISALPALFLIHVFMKDPSLIPFVNIKENLTLLSIIARRARERDDHTHCKAEKHMID